MRNDLQSAQALHYELAPLSRVLFSETNPIPVKKAMEILGLANGRLRLPLAPLGRENEMVLREVLKDLGVHIMIRAAVTGASGRMGKLIISNIVASEGMELSAAFDLVNIGKDAGESAQVGNLGVPISDVKDMAHVLKESSTNVLIDFTIANATVVNAPIAASAGVNLVVGTTGFSSEQKEVMEAAISRHGVAGIISPNFSVGVNVFFKILAEASKYLEDYDIEIIEAHHNKKKDAPSGTAMKAADVISGVLGGKDYVFGRQGSCSP